MKIRKIDKMKIKVIAFRFMILISLFITLMACGSDDTPKVSELPDPSWDVKLNGVDFSVSRTDLSAYYSDFDEAFLIGGTKSRITDERIVMTFSVEKENLPFKEVEKFDLIESTGHRLLYFDGNGNNYSSHFFDGTGTFNVSQYIDTETTDFLSGFVNGTLYNKEDSTSVTVNGFLGVNIY